MTRRAFSLIELLVVLTVLAILAALLFPVFAKARGLSRRTVCSSNLRQVNTAMQLYLADHDDGLPVPYDPFRRVSWAAQLNPYLKQFRVFRCPNQVDATFAGRSIWEPPYNVPGNVSIWQSFGFNADHLAPAQPDCRDFDQNGRMTGPPASVFLAADPARTVLCVGVSLAPGPGSWVGRNTRFPAGGGYFLAPAPATKGSRDACAYPDGGWGQGSYLGPIGGFEALRHEGRGNVLFLDGHLGALTPAQLAAGTNWTSDALNTQVVITDSTRYLWDLK